LIVTTQEPVPEQAPLQPLNSEPAPADGVSVTTVPKSYWWVQVPELQLIPAGLEETEPVPEPVTLTESWRFSRPKVALTDLAALIVTTHFLPASSSESQPVH